MTAVEREGLKFWPYCRSKCPPGKGCRFRRDFVPIKGESTGEGWMRLKIVCKKLPKAK